MRRNKKISLPNEYNLTDNERFVIQRTAQGYSGSEIAVMLRLSVQTITNTKYTLMGKLKASTMIEVVHHLHEMNLWNLLIREEKVYG